MIPIYNPRTDYLRATLESVLRQDPGPDVMQIEVLDDHSTDENVAELIRGIAGGRISFYRTSENLGLASVWNLCVERAKGECVHILHQDDLVYNGFYKSLRLGIERNKEVGAAFCRHAFCDENGHWIELSGLESSEATVFPNFVESLVTGHRIQCASMVVKRATYEVVGGYNPELTHAVDWEMWIRIASHFPLFYEPAILAAWRVHREATTNRQMQTGENIRDIIKATGIWRQYLPEEEATRLSRIAKERFAREALGTAKWFLLHNNRKAALRQVLAALRCSQSMGVIARAVLLTLKSVIRKQHA